MSGTQLDVYRDQLLSPERKRDLFAGMPAHIKPEVFERNLFNALMANPKLMDYPAPLVYREVAKAAGLGLLLDPILGEAYLVEAWNAKAGRKEPQLRVGYKGFIKLARQTDKVANLYCHEICQYDDVECDLGFPKIWHHRPKNLFGDRGPVVGYVALIAFSNGEFDFEPMSLAECLAIRDRSDAWKAFSEGRIKSTPWSTDENEMCKKTVYRRLMKRQSQSTEMLEAQRIEDDAEFPSIGHNQGPALDRDAGPPRLSAPAQMASDGHNASQQPAGERSTPAHQEQVAQPKDAEPPRQAQETATEQKSPPKRQRTNAKKGEANRAAAKQAATKPVTPHHIEPGTHTFESWSEEYIRNLDTAPDPATVYQWVDLNRKRLDKLAEGAKTKPIAAEWEKKVKLFTEQKLTALRVNANQQSEMDDEPEGQWGNASDARQPENTSAPKHFRADPMKNPQQPENFLSWLDKIMGEIEDAETLDAFWNDEGAPLVDQLDFPPDIEQAQSIHRKHEQRLGAD